MSSLNIREEYHLIQTILIRADCCTFLAFLWLAFSKINPLNNTEWYHSNKNNQNSDKFDMSRMPQLFGFSSTNLFRSELPKFCRMISFEQKNNQNSDKFDTSRFPQLFGFSSTYLFRSELPKYCRMILFKQKLIKIPTNLIRADCRNFLAFLQLTFWSSNFLWLP